MSADGTTALIGADQVDSGKARPTCSTSRADGILGFRVVDPDGHPDQLRRRLRCLLRATPWRMSADGTTARHRGRGRELVTGNGLRVPRRWRRIVGHLFGTDSHTDQLGRRFGSEFGISVALTADGTTTVIGAEGVSSSTGRQAYVFHVAGEGAWATSSAPTATLTNSAGASDDAFGSSVALSADGTTAVIEEPSA